MNSDKFRQELVLISRSAETLKKRAKTLIDAMDKKVVQRNNSTRIMLDGESVTITHANKICKAQFDVVRRRFKKEGGTAGGLNTEWDNFRKKNGTKYAWADLALCLGEKLNNWIKWRRAREAKGEKVEPMVHFSTFINQRRWEHAEDVAKRGPGFTISP